MKKHVNHRDGIFIYGKWKKKIYNRLEYKTPYKEIGSGKKFIKRRYGKIEKHNLVTVKLVLCQMDTLK